jgi:zinc transporter ZupT
VASVVLLVLGVVCLLAGGVAYLRRAPMVPWAFLFVAGAVLAVVSAALQPAADRG